MGFRFDEQNEREERLDRDHEHEGGYGRYLPFRATFRPSATVTLIPKASGVLHTCPHDLVEYVGVRGRITHKVCARCRADLGPVGGSK